MIQRLKHPAVLAAIIFAAVLLLLQLSILLHVLGPNAPRHDSHAASGSAWPVFRGDARLSGIAHGELPDHPVSLWTFRTGASIKSSPVIADDRVFIGSDDGNVYALRLADGTQLWAFATGDNVEAPPLYLDGTIFVGSANGCFYALDARTGKTIWTNQTGDRMLGSANYVLAGSNAAARVFVGSYDTTMYCFDAVTGSSLWQFATGNYINGAPAVDGDRVVFGGCDAHLHVLSAATGAEITSIDAGAYIAASAALAGGRAFVGHYNNQLVCANLDTHLIEWSYGDQDNGAPFFSCPAVTADRVLAGARDNCLHCIDRRTGTNLWTFRAQGDVDSSPVVCGDAVIVGSNDGRLYIVNLSNGALRWRYEIGKPISASPAVAGGMIVIGAEDGRVYAFGAK